MQGCTMVASVICWCVEIQSMHSATSVDSAPSPSNLRSIDAPPLRLGKKYVSAFQPFYWI